MRKRNYKQQLAKENIQRILSLIQRNLNEEMHKKYVKEILRIAHSFNIRLKREEKTKFCKKCFTPWNYKTRIIRINKKRKEIRYICKNCGYQKIFGINYKKNKNKR